MEIQKVILKLKDRGISIIITDHNIRDTFNITDKVYIIHMGEILTSGPPPKVVKEDKTRELFLGYHFEWESERDEIHPG
jgi:lipopolysaccharide export system ATP-binding protein